MNKDTVVIEKTYNTSIARVWAALTDPAQIKHWFVDMPDFRPEIGSEFSFTHVNETGFVKRHICRVTEVVPGRRLAYSWGYDGYPGDSLVTIELTSSGPKTILKLTHTGLDALPKKITDMGMGFQAGWTHFIGESLEQYLALNDK